MQMIYPVSESMHRDMTRVHRRRMRQRMARSFWLQLRGRLPRVSRG